MKQIIAMGGGGFSMEPDNLLLDQYILAQSTVAKPKVCFIPTASGDADNYINRFYEAFGKLDCIPTHLSLFKPPTRDLRDFVLQQDILYVGGGNTKNLLTLWKEWELDDMIREAWEKGIVLSGISAGSLCWFEEGITDSYGDEFESIQCLGFLKGSHCPHYNGESDYRSAYQNLIGSRVIKSGIAADDGVAIHYIDQEIKTIVSSRPNAFAYRVYNDQYVHEEKLPVTYLG